MRGREEEFFNLRNIGRRVSPTFKGIKKFAKPIYTNFWLSQVSFTNGVKENFFSFHLPINQFLCRFPPSAPVFPASEKGEKLFDPSSSKIPPSPGRSVTPATNCLRLKKGEGGTKLPPSLLLLRSLVCGERKKLFPDV